MKKQESHCEVEQTTTEEQLNTLFESYDFERIEYIKIVCDTARGCGWFILACCVVKIWSKWLNKKEIE